MGAKGLKLNYFRIALENWGEIESARIHNYIQGRAQGRGLYILVPSYLSRYNPLVRSTPAGVRTPVATKISAKNDSTDRVPGPHQAAEATVGASNH